MPQYRFGDFRVDTDTVEVWGPDGIRDVEPQVFGVLQYFVEQGDRLVTKDELLENVWGNKFVSESALTTRIKQARRALDDDGARQWAIKTVHGRGYRFVPPVEQVTAAPAVETRQATTLPDELRMGGRRPFCGRVEELRQGAEVVREAAVDGPLGWVWVLGEPGIGKSRLAAELAADAHAQGHRVVFGRNSEDLRVPYQPFVEVIGQLAGPGRADPEIPELPEELLPLLPTSVVAGHPAGAGRAARASVDDEGRRFHLFEALAGWLERCAASRPVTIVVDDVHWAAESTLQLLAHLQQRPGQAAVTLVLTARDTAPDASERIADLMATAQGRPRTVLVHLVGLRVAEAAQLVGDEGVDMAEVMRQTAGNPLFLQAVDPVAGAVHIEGAVRRRLATLPAEIQDNLRMLSVLGLEFELTVAAAAQGRDELELLDDLEAAVAARLLEDIGVDRFRFAHALVRSSRRDQISSARRTRMHRRIADALERTFPDDLAHLPELAFHTAEAARGDADLRPVAVDRLQRAAEAAIDRFSFDEAADLLAQARALAVDGDATTRTLLALSHGSAESRTGRNVPAARIFEEAIVLAREAEDVVLRVEAALGYEDARWRPGLDGAQSMVHLEEAAALLDAEAEAGREVEGEADLRARLAVARLRALAMSERQGEADDAFTEAIGLSTAMGSPTMEANVLSVYLGHVVLHRGVRDAGPMIARLAELEPEIDNGDVALHALHDRIMFATLTGDWPESRRLVQVMARQQERWRSSFWEFIRTNQEAMEAYYRGDLDGSERLANRCLTLAKRLPDEDATGTYGLRMFLVRREQDRLAAVAPMIRTVVAAAGGGDLWTPGLAWLLAETGSVEEAEEVLGDLRAAQFLLPLDSMWSTVMVFLIETMVRAGDRTSCALLRERFAHLEGTNVTTGAGQFCFGRADRYLGMLSLTLGELELAEQQLGAALEGDDAGGSVLWANDSRLWLSRVRRAQGYDAEADAMARVVLAEAQAHGLHRLARVAAAELG
ncbi:AAA family ATPase [Nocardioides sp.]|uniref:AAA family ATPase n=1 Tax=Nocardioides sp. TaxID=35761 RepID=UPI003527EE5B